VLLPEKGRDFDEDLAWRVWILRNASFCSTFKISRQAEFNAPSISKMRHIRKHIQARSIAEFQIKYWRSLCTVYAQVWTSTVAAAMPWGIKAPTPQGHSEDEMPLDHSVSCVVFEAAE
jgi:hypothetical protein